MGKLIFFLSAASAICGSLFASDAFTGKVTGNHVRMRLHPSLDGTVIDELDKEDLVVVAGESDEFFAVQPPKYIKAYIYRTYVVDGVVEGNRVNIRLDPHLDAPVIGQLEQGTKVDGEISRVNSKWYEINLPENIYFYISKHFIERVGGPELMAKQEARKEEVAHLLSTSIEIANAEMKKPFPQINLEGVYSNLNKITQEYNEYSEQVEKAHKILALLQDDYLKMKVAYLESQTREDAQGLKARNSQLLSQMNELEKKLETTHKRQTTNVGGLPTAKMGQWIPVEEKIYLSWSEENQGRSRSDFEKEQLEDSVLLRGVVETYDRPVRNKPGDFLLINKANELPIAFLYSTEENLQQYVGQEVTVRATLRPNHHFAYPAYYVISVE